jgi:hypothetical protein
VWGWRERVIGIVLGVALGVGVIVAFVFLFSEKTVDAPSLSGGQPPPSTSRPVATVRITGGAPPGSGLPERRYQQGDEIRLRVVTDTKVNVELTGFGLTRTVSANQPTEIDVEARRPGNFALIVPDSNTTVARIIVARHS